MVLSRFELNTPLGPVTILQSNKGICRLVLGAGEVESLLKKWRLRFAPEESCVEGDPDSELSEALQVYFSGEKQTPTVRLDLRGSEFQKKVWQELLRIPFGHVVSYGQVAAGIGAPGASQAVGAANGANPVPILVPCHRVVSSKGLGGFSGPMEWKLGLLRLEGVCLDFG
jgi:O-6-methylguanine DNA methyltransferase